MTRDEADAQVAALARRLGAGAPVLPARVRLHEALLGFEYVEAERALSVLASIYRFRAAPRPGVVQAVLAAATPENTGGGRLVVEAGDVLVLRRNFVETTSGRRFAGEVDRLARASLLWAGDLLARAAESVPAPPEP